MRKVGVILFLSLLTLSSLILISNMNFSADKLVSNEDGKETGVLLTSDDSFEENDVFLQAKDIDPNYYSSLSCEDDDWYKFWVDKGNDLFVHINFVRTNGDLKLQLFDDSNLFIKESNSFFNEEKLNHTATYSGFYYIKIFNFAVYNNYDLDIYLIFDKYEPNNIFAEAPEIYKGFHRGLYCKDDDYYRVNVKLGEEITVKILYDQFNGDIDLEIYDPFYGFIGRSDNWDKDFDQLTFIVSHTGFYYIRVYPKVATYKNWYDMKIINPEITLFYEDFEGTLSPRWTGLGEGNYWHVTTQDYSPANPVSSLWCANQSSGSYEKRENSMPIEYKDSVAITDLDLKDYCYLELNFEYNYSAGWGENVSISARITAEDYYLNPKYTNNELILEDDLSMSSGWKNHTIDLSFFCGYEHVDIIFSFHADTIDYWDEGIKIDNIRIRGSKDDNLLGSSLGINIGDEFYYHFPYVDENSWKNEIFGKHIHGLEGGEIKIEIFKINDQGTYWDVIARFWEPIDDFDELTGTDEIHYKIYKNALNMKQGSDFFIPANNIMQYLDRADNYDWFNDYGIDHWYSSQWRDYHVFFDYDDFGVELIYMSNGVLSGMMVWRKYDGHRIFEMWYGEPEDDDDEEEEEYQNSIPGYDMIIVISTLSIISVLMVLRFKHSKKK
ncbi:MAG: hypothetical protein EU551_04480 [Promethearchaeota archaeon]|nr:MAG: hypothetical protein EU551_04480 [Candidatus Lokiarchaeota archaeon]